MEEKKINQQSRVAESEIIIDSVQPYRENYQMRMLKNNRIPGLLRVSGCGMEGASRYYYHTGHTQSLETYYKNKDIRAEEILKLTRQFNKARENYAVMEEKRYGPIKKFAKRFKSGKWGEWEDLITEADDYE